MKNKTKSADSALLPELDRVAWNMEERDVETIRGKSPKQAQRT